MRGFWSETWHNFLTIPLTAPGRALADKCHLSARSPLRYALVAVISFTFSGLLHAGIIPPEPLWATVSTGTLKTNMTLFFAMQPLGLLIETVLARAAVWATSRAGGTVWWKQGPGLVVRMVLTGLWTYFWFCLSSEVFVDTLKQLGYFRQAAMPFSVFMGRGGGYLY